jgi:hypothetical protein
MMRLEDVTSSSSMRHSRNHPRTRTSRHSFNSGKVPTRRPADQSPGCGRRPSSQRLHSCSKSPGSPVVRVLDQLPKVHCGHHTRSLRPHTKAMRIPPGSRVICLLSITTCTDVSLSSSTSQSTPYYLKTKRGMRLWKKCRNASTYSPNELEAEEEDHRTDPVCPGELIWTSSCGGSSSAMGPAAPHGPKKR